MLGFFFEGGFSVMVGLVGVGYYLDLRGIY